MVWGEHGFGRTRRAGNYPTMQSVAKQEMWKMPTAIGIENHESVTGAEFSALEP